MYIETFIVSFLIGLLRKGSIANFKLFNLNKICLLLAALAAQVIININFLNIDNLYYLGAALHISSYFLLFIFFWANRHILNYLLVIGAALNFAAVSLNGGAMPVHTIHMPDAAVEKINNSVTHTVLDEATRVPWLADIFHVSWPFQQMISIGDVFICIGIFALVQKIMLFHKKS